MTQFLDIGFFAFLGIAVVASTISTNRHWRRLTKAERERFRDESRNSGDW